MDTSLAPGHLPAGLDVCSLLYRERAHPHWVLLLCHLPLLSSCDSCGLGMRWQGSLPGEQALFPAGQVTPVSTSQPVWGMRPGVGAVARDKHRARGCFLHFLSVQPLRTPSCFLVGQAGTVGGAGEGETGRDHGGQGRVCGRWGGSVVDGAWSWGTLDGCGGTAEL